MKKMMMENGDWRLKYRGITLKRFYCLLSIIFLFLSTCGGPLNSPARQKTFPAGEGSITLVVDEASGRTILPESGIGKFAAYTILFYESGTDTLLATEYRTSADLPFSFYLIPGTYDIKVTAYIDGERTKAAAQGSLYNIEIKTGVNAAHNITLNPITTVNSTGTFRWNITVPSGLSSASMTITPVDPETGTPVINKSFTETTFTDSLTLKTGYYNILIKLKKTDNEQEISFREFLHVYDNLESSFSRVFTNDHFNNIKYTITYVFDNGTTLDLQNDCLHGEQATNHIPAVSKPTPAGLYLGTPPESQTFAGWNDESGAPWNFANPVTRDMELTAQWTASGLVPYASVPKNNVDIAVAYINTNKGTYTLLMDGNASVSSAIYLTSNTALTIRGLSSIIIITPGSFNIENNAALTVGSNINFTGIGTLFIDSGASITLSGNAAISILTLFATNTVNSSVTIDSGWTGAVERLNLRGDNTGINTVISFWYKKDSPVTVLKGGGLNAATVAKFTTVYFINNTSADQSITTANPPDAPGGYRISASGEDIGKLVAINYAARVVTGLNAGDYPTLNEAITKADNGSATNPTEIVILRDITAPEEGASINYTIPSGKHIKLTVEAGKDITINAPAGNLALFKLSTNSSLTLDGGDGKITLDGKGTTAGVDRHGVHVLYGTFKMENNVTITGFYNSDDYGGGGGVYVSDGATFIMNNGTITGNRANGLYRGGGGVYTGGTFNMNGGTIKDNFSNSGGGGVYVGYGTFTMNNDAIIENNTVDGNLGHYGGGGVYLNIGTVIMNNNAEIKGNSSTNGNGCGVYVNGTSQSDATFILNSGIITDNKTTNTNRQGGGVYVTGKDGTFEMNGGEISYNNTGYGGGVFVIDGNFIMSAGKIYGNKAFSNDGSNSVGGGGVYLANSSTFTMSGGKIYNNTTTEGVGGGLYMGSGIFDMTGGEIFNNTAKLGGGGVIINYGTFNMSNGEIYGNTAFYGVGGGVYINDSNVTFTMSGGTIYGIDNEDKTNKAPDGIPTDNGASIYVQSGTAQYGDTYGTGTITTTNDTLPPQPFTSPEGGIELVWIPAGTFMMGSPMTESGRDYNETYHNVTLTKSFYMGKYEVTQEQWIKVMGNSEDHTTTYGKGNDYPVYYVSWYDALVFCNRLSMMENLNPVYIIDSSTDPDAWGTVPTAYDDLNRAKWDTAVMDMSKNGYRLPTEAEWEYACRAGTTTAFNNGNDDYTNTTSVGAVAWYSGNSGNKTHEVGDKLPNAWGLYDMHGNVSEWCWDVYNSSSYGSSQIDPVGPSWASDNSRVRRGGSWVDSAIYLRSAYRIYGTSENSRLNSIGLRVVRTIQ